MTIYLYKKIHKVTGLKYLGKTSSKNPHSYRGSGSYWLNHINKHGYHCDTEILKECQSNEEIKKWGIYYSKLWDVVNSSEWANLKPEEGDGGGAGAEGGRKISSALTGRKRPDHSRTLTGRKRPEQSKYMMGNPSRTGMKNSEESNIRRRESCSGEKSSRHGVKDPSYLCIHCNKMISGLGNFNRWHGDNCKSKRT